MENAWLSLALGCLGSDGSQKVVFVGLTQPATAWPGSGRPGAVRSAREEAVPTAACQPGPAKDPEGAASQGLAEQRSRGCSPGLFLVTPFPG